MNINALNIFDPSLPHLILSPFNNRNAKQLLKRRKKDLKFKIYSMLLLSSGKRLTFKPKYPITYLASKCC